MAWSSRIQEHRSPYRVIPGSRTFTELFDSEEGPLHSRDAVMGQLTVSFSRLFPMFLHNGMP